MHVTALLDTTARSVDACLFAWCSWSGHTASLARWTCWPKSAYFENVSHEGRVGFLFIAGSLDSAVTVWRVKNPIRGSASTWSIDPSSAVARYRTKREEDRKMVPMVLGGKQNGRKRISPRFSLTGSAERPSNRLIESDWLRGQDLNLRPLGYEPNELPDCSTPHCQNNTGLKPNF